MARKKTGSEKPQRVGDLMTTDPIVLDADATVTEAARCMRDENVGDVLVRKEGRLRGIVTDRDLVVRCLAEDDGSPGEHKIEEICSGEIVTLPPDADVDEAIELMREKAVRRIPIVDGDQPVGILSLGDLAVARDRRSALADISAAPPNR